MNVVIVSPKYPENCFAQNEVSGSERGPSSDHWAGGLGIHTARLANMLSENNCHVTVFAYSPVTAGISREGDVTVCRISLSGEQQNVDPESQEGLAILEKRFMEAVAEVISGRGAFPDVIHCHHHTCLAVAGKLRSAFHAPVVSTFHFLLSGLGHPSPEPILDRVRNMESMVAKSSDRIIAISRWMKKNIMQTLDLLSDKVEVVHHGVEIAPKRPDGNGAAAWRQRIAPLGERIILYVGRLTPEKGIAELLDSARLLLRRVGSVKYVLAGGSNEQVLAMQQNVSSDPVLRGHFYFAGWLAEDQLRELRAAADLAVVPSRYESFGYSAAEAMAASIPVVATNAGGLPEIVAHNKTGLLVPLHSTNGSPDLTVRKLAEAQHRLLNDPELCRRLSRAGLERAQKHFSVQTMLRKTLRIYQDARRFYCRVE